VTARLIEWRSVYEARLTDEEVAERLLALGTKARVNVDLPTIPLQR
jgi:hypothetical protein